MFESADRNHKKTAVFYSGTYMYQQSVIALDVGTYIYQ